MAPTTGLWQIDPARARVAFAGRVARLAPSFRARFDDIGGSVQIGDTPEDSTVSVDVRLASMTTGNRTWDELLRTLDPFELERFPVATYRSTCATWRGTKGSVLGRLTMHGATRPVRLLVEHEFDATSGATAFRATGSVNREEFGVRCDLPGLSRLVPREMQLEIDVVTKAQLFLPGQHRHRD
jgi:polyisoprenoid-binding protein YceI